MTSDDQDKCALDREALEWLVRLDDRPDDEALYAAIAAWQERSAAHRASWESALDLAATVRTALPQAALPTAANDSTASADEAHTLDNLVHLPIPSLRRRSLLRHWRTIGGLAAAACLGLVVAPDMALHMQAQELTGTAEVRTIALSDGTRVVLAPGSALSFDSDGSKRTAHLLRGRAFFDVARDAARPFEVMARKTKVTVLGTAFEVDSLSENASVAVSRGIVAVDYAGHAPRTVLHRGETVALAPNGRVISGTLRSDRVAGWIDGRLFVKDRPVSEVLEALRPWYRGYIIARGPGLNERRVTGIYDLRNPEAALTALGKVHPLQVRRITPWLKVVTVD